MTDRLAEIKKRQKHGDITIGPRADSDVEWLIEALEGVILLKDEYAAEIERLRAALDIEHEIQRQFLERLGIAWTPGEPFYALIEDEINRLRWP